MNINNNPEQHKHDLKKSSSYLAFEIVNCYNVHYNGVHQKIIEFQSMLVVFELNTSTSYSNNTDTGSFFQLLLFFNFLGFYFF